MARIINKTDIIAALGKQVASASAAVRNAPFLKEAIADALGHVAPDHVILESDLTAIIRELSTKRQITANLITETVRTVVEAKEQSVLEITVNHLLSKMRPPGFDTRDAVKLIIQRGKLRANSSLSKIQQAIGDFLSSPRNIKDVTQIELRDAIRKELAKRGPVDARQVNQLAQQYQRSAAPGQTFSHADIQKLVKDASSRITVKPPAGAVDATIKPLDAQKRKKASDNSNPFVVSSKTLPTGTPYRKTFFDTIRTKMQRYGLRPLTRQARNWLTDSIQKAAAPSQAQLFKRSVVATSMAEAFIGKMFLYAYEAKTADDLPYWDKFPLIFVVDIYEDGWLGINLHYLPMRLRLTLFDSLLSLADNSSLDHLQRLRISYQFLKSFSNFPLVKPCLKRYLMHHVESNLLPVQSIDWEIAVFLPCEQFQKQPKERVWSESRKIIQKQQAK